MIHIYQLVDAYGYWLVALGAFFEGDTFLVAGGVAAQKHLLNMLYLVIISIFLSMFHDGLLFYVGRTMGLRILKKYPKIEQKMTKVFENIDKYGILVILILRFAYGFRTLIPIAIGMGKISDKKFFFYDFLGGIIWSLSFILGGVLFGKAMNVFIRKFQIFGDLENLTILIVVVIVLIAFLVGIYHWIKKIKIKQRLQKLALIKLEIEEFKKIKNKK
jgi:membrane protein DedA with SNARE-associated domain